MNRIINFPAPAKLNLFLHVVGQRPDGYHLLETAFRLINLPDFLDFYESDDSQIERINSVEDVPPEEDLCFKAAKLLQKETGCKKGVRYRLNKFIPVGGGLGGGSSDAASTLIALNSFWGLNLKRKELLELARRLGADVPLFIGGENCFAKGIGDILQPLEMPAKWYSIIQPDLSISTKEIFSDPLLTKNSESVKIQDFIAQLNTDSFELFGRNDLEPVVFERYETIKLMATVIEGITDTSNSVRVTGSGACLFTQHSTREEAVDLLDRIRVMVPGIKFSCVVNGLDKHPKSRLIPS